MADKKFQAMIVKEGEDKQFTRKICEQSISDLPDGDVLIRVLYSALNYKDALSATGNRGVTRKYPHTPGVDAAGIVEQSNVDSFKPGDNVIVTSYDLGMNTAGGFGQYIRVPAGWVIPLPEKLTIKQSMIYGTAGLTTGMCVSRIMTGGITPDSGDVLVTGATGGVGSMAVAILAKCGYKVVGVTGKSTETEYLKNLGAADIMTREDATDSGKSPLLKARWAGVVDTVGGDILATAIKSAMPNAVVTCCGLVASPNLPLTVFPFILRGISLIGIDSQNYPMSDRVSIWKNLSEKWKPDSLESMGNEVELKDLNPKIDEILKGQIKGRIIVKLDDQ